MAKISVELDKEDLLTLVMGTSGPGDYSNNFSHLGKLYGFPNERWGWNEEALERMTEEQLLDEYQKLKSYKRKQNGKDSQ